MLRAAIRIGAVLLAWVMLASACGDDDDDAAPQDGKVSSVDAKGLDDYNAAPVPEGIAVAASVETEPVGGVGDSADDPAIWVHPNNPELSLFLGTDKGTEGGLYTYNLDGSLHEFFPIGEFNNVDLRVGFELAGEQVTLVTGVNRTKNTLVVLALDHATRKLRDVAAREVVVTPAGYGSCMYRGADAQFYAFVDSTSGIVEQYKLVAVGDKVDAQKVRSFCVETQPEACVADDEQGFVFLGEEAFGIWKFAAEPTAAPVGTDTPNCQGAIAGVIVDKTEGGHILPDVEGLAIATTGPNQGYLFASSQGESEFVIYDRAAPHAYIKTFHVFGGGPVCIDGVEHSDGIAATSAALGAEFPHGAFITQDGYNGDPVAHQNFKVVPLDDILEERSGVNDACRLGDYGGKYRVAELPAGPEHTPEFCAAFCQRCSECYASFGGKGFAEGDCHYKSPKPVFDHDDCLEGCNAGVNPHDTSPLQAGWEQLECLALDDAL